MYLLVASCVIVLGFKRCQPSVNVLLSIAIADIKPRRGKKTKPIKTSDLDP